MFDECEPGCDWFMANSRMGDFALLASIAHATLSKARFFHAGVQATAAGARLVVL